MVHGPLAFLVLVAFAVVGTELRTALARRGLWAPALEGLAFLAIGLALGDRGLAVFPADILETLRPVVLLGLAWIGFTFGLEVDLAVIRRLQPWHLRAGLAVPAVVGLVVFAAGRAGGLEPAVALGVAAVAMVVSPSTLEGLARVRGARDRGAMRLLKLVMAFTGLPAVAVLLAATVLASPIAGPSVPVWQLVVITAGAGLLVGYGVVVISRGVAEQLAILTILIGAGAVLAGSAAVLGVGGLPVAACAGAVVANRVVFPHRILRAAHSLERPMLLALLVLVGASWRGVAFSWLVFLLMVVVRGAVLTAAGRVLEMVARRHRVPVTVPWLGLGLLPQGELALGFLVVVVGLAPEVDGVLEAVLASMVLGQLVAGAWMRRSLFTLPRGAPGAAP